MIIAIGKNNDQAGHDLAEKINSRINGQIFSIKKTIEKEQAVLSEPVEENERFMAFTHHLYHITKRNGAVPVIVEDVTRFQELEFIYLRGATTEQRVVFIELVDPTCPPAFENWPTNPKANYAVYLCPDGAINPATEEDLIEKVELDIIRENRK